MTVSYLTDLVNFSDSAARAPLHPHPFIFLDGTVNRIPYNGGRYASNDVADNCAAIACARITDAVHVLDEPTLMRIYLKRRDAKKVRRWRRPATSQDGHQLR
jgi:hypothetical protein